MSCQSVIDQFLSEDGKFQRTITVIGESGSASVPSHCAVSFQECNLSSLEVAAHSTVVLCKCNVSGDVRQIDGVFTADRCTFTGKLVLVTTKGTEKLCTHKDSTILQQGATLDAFNTVREAGSGQWGLQALEGSRALLLHDDNQGYDYAIEADTASVVVARASILVGKQTGVRCLGGSKVEVTAGEVAGQDEFAVHAEGISQVSLSALEKPLSGNQAAINCTDSSKVTVTNTAIVRGDQIGIQATKSGVVEVFRFTKVLGQGGVAVCAETGATVSLMVGDTLISEGAEAIKASSGSTVSVVNVTTVSSEPSTAVSSFGGCSVTLRSISSRVIGQGGNGIQAGDNDVYTLSNIPQIRGVSGHGLVSGSSTRITITDVAEIQGVSGHGFVLGDGNSVVCSKVDKILGNTGTGIVAGNDLKISLLDVKAIIGEDADGIVTGNRAVLRGESLGEITGVEGRGIVVGSKSDLEIVNFDKIVGWMGDCIEAPSSRVVLRNGNRVDAPTIGEGVQVDGSGGVVVLSNIVRLNAEEGDGIRISKGTLEVQRCGRIGGGGAGINLQESSNGTVHTLSRLFGGDIGLRCEGGSRGDFSAVDSWEGGGEGGIGCKQSVVVANAVGELIGNPYAIRSEDGSSVSLHTSTAIGDILADSESSVRLADCEVVGGGMATDSLLEGSRVSFTKDITATDSVISLSRGSVGGGVTCTGSGITCSKVEISGQVVLAASGGVFVKCTSTPPVLTDGGALAAGCDMGEATVVGSSWIHASAAEALVRSELLVRLQADEILEVTT